MIQLSMLSEKRSAGILLALMVLVTFSVAPQSANAQQVRAKEKHTRGMLHETVYNTGEIGKKWFYRDHDITLDPQMEWPGGSSTIIDGTQYSGQHNIIGGGISIAASYPENNIFDTSKRLYSFSGSAGEHVPITVAGVYAFPTGLERIENFPLLEDGSVNSAYDPDEAEEIIIASWATNTGISVTRTSRAWSYPDYDDFIIFEYEFENTGDRNGDMVADTTATLNEIMIGFHYGVAPSMLGYQRWYGTWEYDFMYKNDMKAYFDRHRWLRYVLNTGNGLMSDERTAGKPDPVHFREFAASGAQGGGLMSPQAPGIQMLYYDVDHLAREGETIALHPNVADSINIDAAGRLKQPFMNKVESGNARESKMIPKLVPFTRWSGTYTNFRETTYPPDPALEDPMSERWTGRGAFNFRQSYKAVGSHITFGPYILEPGEKMRFAMAEVVGYGATEDPNDPDEGGGLGEAIDEQDPWHFPPRWNQPVALANVDGTAGEVLTEDYLGNYGYPDYVNSDVRTVKDVADKAYQAYTGREPVLPLWPEDNPSTGVYRLPAPPPAPILQTGNNEFAHAVIRWGRGAESFTHPRQTGPIASYRAWKSSSAIGPWTLLAEISVGDAGNMTDDGLYEVLDERTIVGESQYYSVTSVDVSGIQSGRTNIANVIAQLGAASELGTVHVVPNPFYVESGYTGGGVSGGNSTPASQIGFYGLPEKCTIRIFSYSGQLIDTIEHDAQEYSTAWFQVSRNEQEIASGVYFYVVETPDGQMARGKFVIIK
jgi:hypothetical protein